MEKYIQNYYFNAYYDASKIAIEDLRVIVWKAWEAIPENYIQSLFDSWYDR
jgi:hypothetical protein